MVGEKPLLFEVPQLGSPGSMWEEGNETRGQPLWSLEEILDHYWSTLETCSSVVFLSEPSPEMGDVHACYHAIPPVWLPLNDFMSLHSPLPPIVPAGVEQEGGLREGSRGAS